MASATRVRAVDLLPDDLLADVLARLPPCSLAASRCVRKHWCAVIDTRRLLRADLLPLRLDGFFCKLAVPRNQDDDSTGFFFARSSTARRISADFFCDHCNGVLVIFDYVVNPATRQWVHLPSFPDYTFTIAGMEEHLFHICYFLAYDPMVSPHYEVVLVPVPNMPKEDDIKLNESSDWPPSPFTTQVFSSRKWRWEERSFVREGEAAGTIADMHWRYERRHRGAVYLQGALYVHCQNDSVMRITLQNDKYRMIKSPAENQDVAYLGKCQRGVYFVLLSEENMWPRFRAWLLNESCGQMEWVLKNDISLQAVVENYYLPDVCTDGYITPWIVKFQDEDEDEDDVSEVQPEDESDWDFDSGVVLHETKDKVSTNYVEMFFLGFHPYKEIAFFLVPWTKWVVSYHLNTSKVQELGILNEFISSSFPYTPCWMKLFENN